MALRSGMLLLTFRSNLLPARTLHRSNGKHYHKMLCLKIEDCILGEEVIESKLSRVSFACRMHGNFSRARRKYWTEQEMNTEIFNENRYAMNQNISERSFRVSTYLGSSKNSSFRHQSFFFILNLISIHYLVYWIAGRRQKQSKNSSSPLVRSDKFRRLPLYSSSWDFIIFICSLFSPSICIDYSISLCWSPFFPWLPCNNLVSLLAFPFIFSSWCQVLIYVFPFFTDVNTDARVRAPFSAWYQILH